MIYVALLNGEEQVLQYYANKRHLVQKVNCNNANGVSMKQNKMKSFYSQINSAVILTEAADCQVLNYVPQTRNGFLNLLLTFSLTKSHNS